MKVYVYPADTHGCGTVRLIWSANHLRRTGHDVTIVPPSSKTGIGGEVYQNKANPDDPRNGTIVRVIAPDDADVIVLQRVLLRQLAEGIPMLRKRGIAVVVDMDDDLTRIDPDNVAFLAMHPRTDPNRNWAHAHRACLNATAVTVSTPALLRTYAPHGRGVVIPNRIPAGFLSIPHEDSDVIGWAGSLHSHPKDMQPVGSAIARLVREGGEFTVVGSPAGLGAALGLERDPAGTGPVPIERWPFMIAETLGVGIAPLADTDFNAAKSWLKPLEMMSLGVPWVASPRVEYRTLQKETGVGLLADRPKDWFRHLKRLTTDDQLRQEMSLAGREAARAYTVEANAWRLWEVWSDAFKAERGRLRNASPFRRAG